MIHVLVSKKGICSTIGEARSWGRDEPVPDVSFTDLWEVLYEEECGAGLQGFGEEDTAWDR